MNAREAATRIQQEVGSLSRRMDLKDYQEFLGEVLADVEARLEALHEDDTE